MLRNVEEIFVRVRSCLTSVGNKFPGTTIDTNHKSRANNLAALSLPHTQTHCRAI